MNIALIGSHGTGKTTVIDYLKRKYPQHHFYGDIFRELASRLGYERPRAIADESGITPYVSAALNAYHHVEQPAIFDQGPVVIYAYYLAYLDRDRGKVTPFVEKLAMHHAQLVDHYIYFPVGKIPLITDDMRPGELDFQKKVDECIQRALEACGVPADRVYTVESIGIADRVKEVESFIEGAMEK